MYSLSNLKYDCIEDMVYLIKRSEAIYTRLVYFRKGKDKTKNEKLQMENYK